MKKRVLSFLIILVMTLGFLPTVAFAGWSPEVITEGDFKYELYNGAIVIEYLGDDTNVTIPASVNDIPVTGISGSVFKDRTNIVSFEIPDSVTSIDSNAFYNTGYYNNADNWENGLLYIDNCLIEAKDTIESADIKAGTRIIAACAFDDCTSLTSIEIPDSVTSIDGYAFSGCSSLTSVNIPDSVTSIDYNVFSGCNSLEKIHITDVAAWCNIDFEYYGCNPLENGADLYLNGQKVTNLVIPDGVTAIKNYAFYGFKSLTSIEIPDSVTSIGTGAFKDCTSLKSVVIPDGVTEIRYGTFSNCSSLTSVTIPASVTSSDEDAFRSCSSIEKVYITDVAAWCNIDFGYYSSTSNPLRSGADLYLNGQKITDLVIPNGVTAIKEDTFYNCSSITSVTIPDSVTSIGSYAFYNCSSITSVTIPDGVISIGDFAFSRCSKFTSIEIPDSVTSIGNRAFMYCTSLTSIDIPDSVTSIGYDAFDDTAYFNNTDNWENGLLYIKDYLIAVDYKIVNADIKDGTRIIGGAFYDSYSLESVVIPDSVTSINDDSFNYCPKLNDVFYTGTKAQKNNIVIGSNNDQLINATWHYNYVPECETHTYDNDADTICNVCNAKGYPGGNTLYKIGTKYYHVVDRKIVKDTTLVLYGGKYLYVKDGVYTKDTTLVKYNGKYLYVKNGVYTKATTLVKYGGKYLYVKNGVYTKGTTLVSYGGKYLYVKNGVYTKATTLVKYNGKWLYVKNGVYTKATTLVKYGNKYYYVKNGVMNSAFSGKVKIGTKTYTIKKGAVV